MKTEGRVRVNGRKKQIDTYKILLDSGALHGSYVSSTWFSTNKDLLPKETIIPTTGKVVLCEYLEPPRFYLL